MGFLRQLKMFITHLYLDSSGQYSYEKMEVVGPIIDSGLTVQYVLPGLLPRKFLFIEVESQSSFM
jgi:hypothetical protein